VFRQVVVYQWAEGVGPDEQQGFRDALESLREIPELLSMTCGDDAGHFDDNIDFVVVADFASARRYVEHPLHQSYVRDHARRVVGQRVVVPHDWTPAP